ncbi:MAG: aspartate ammonia-lyase [Bacteroides sp.]|nr:aspartate ammonia-lyase [Ruminococcus flavefaciens]MCM1554726.1 aspartate ammonia-lyase [Bacteroides sp.]
MAAKTTKTAAASKTVKGSTKTRKEADLLGTKELPADALYGVQALRGFENFKISNVPMYRYPNFIKGFAYTKWGAAIANNQINPKRVDKKQLDAIVAACKEIIAGKHHDAFASDMIQGGAGTTMNMNANEVIANRALQIMGHKPGEYQYCNPNDHVNCSQSTNDAYPTAMHFGLYLSHVEMVAALKQLIKSFEKKGKEFAKMVKMGRTQLQDAVPMTLGQTFNGFAEGLKREVAALDEAAQEFLTVNMGATAIGTGINAEPGYADACAKALASVMKLKIKLDKNLVFVTSDNGAVVNYSSGLKRLAVRLGKVCNDLRLMGSGPRCGLQEVFLPEMQPGSSIMPGKVNPVIPEVVNQVCFRVIGNDLTVTMAADAAQLELNVMEPVMCYAVFESIELLQNAFNTLRTLCIDGLKANEKRCREMVENSIGIITMLNPYIGHHKGDEIAKEAKKTGKSVIELVLKYKLMTKADLDKIMKTENMVNPVKLDIKPAKK